MDDWAVWLFFLHDFHWEPLMESYLSMAFLFLGSQGRCNGIKVILFNSFRLFVSTHHGFMMFLVPKHFKRQDGSIRTTDSLCETRRVHGWPRRKILLHLGKGFSIAKEHWSSLLTQVRGRWMKWSVPAFEENERMEICGEPMLVGWQRME
ncbi:MAG: hypothetical protein OXC67_03085 [Flavobacteriaceae bacterium]|nr:hypothetical protein [Flavobacteriaceae bacterium]MCY4299598.1 hypothetical protein [Flavobacteriaceae bacterium]